MVVSIVNSGQVKCLQLAHQGQKGQQSVEGSVENRCYQKDHITLNI